MLLFWFRRDLRLHDNAGLYHALISGKKVLPVFIFDSAILDNIDDKHDARVSFIHASIANLHKQLEAAGSTLLVKYGKPLPVLQALLQQYPIEGLYTNHDHEPYALQRDKAVEELLLSKGLIFRSFKDQTIFERNELLSKSGTPYKVYTPYKNTWKSNFSEQMASSYDSEGQLAEVYKHTPTPLITLASLGFAPAFIPVPLPDLAAGTLKNYSETRNLPALNATTRLSPHLRFGTISVREAVRLAHVHSETWLQELIWREFFMQLLYHYPGSATESFNPKYKHILWRNNEKEFERWCMGTTGFPLVDAGMRELNATGFMHNRVRMVVASFLIKNLLIDWRWGEAYFANKLLDYEQASNVGNWQWAAGTGADAQPYFRIFNPDSQLKKFDKDYQYIKRWIPEYGTPSYPKPMVLHSETRDRALAAYKAAIAHAQ